MPFHIHQFSNLSPKSVLLTNPVAPRDTHLLPSGGSLAKLDHPPLINLIKTVDISDYETLLGKALNIYTGINNWCFWDFGTNDRLRLLGERTWKVLEIAFDKSASDVHVRLEVDYSGQPFFYLTE
jgi:hypothetical protein